MTLGALLHLYLNQRLRGKPSQPGTARLIRQFFSPWTERPADELRLSEVCTWHATLSHHGAHANKGLKVLRAAYNYGLRFEYLTCLNPTRGIPLHHRPKRGRCMHTDEWPRLRASFEQACLKYRLYFLVLALVGKRPSEPSTMQWADLDWGRARWVNPCTKNGEPDVVVFPAQIMELFRQWSEQRRGPYVFPGRTPFKPMHPASIRKAWGIIRQRAGISGGRFGLWMNDLRRSVASDLSDEKENLQTVRDVLNHSSYEQTVCYTPRNPERARKALQARADRLLS